jgi:hypothetical protein
MARLNTADKAEPIPALVERLHDAEERGTRASDEASQRGNAADADAAHMPFLDQALEIEELIIATPAVTAHDLIAKAKLLKHELSEQSWADDLIGRLALSVIADVERLHAG